MMSWAGVYRHLAGQGVEEDEDGTPPSRTIGRLLDPSRNRQRNAEARLSRSIG